MLKRAYKSKQSERERNSDGSLPPSGQTFNCREFKAAAFSAGKEKKKKVLGCIFIAVSFTVGASGAGRGLAPGVRWAVREAGDFHGVEAKKALDAYEVSNNPSLQKIRGLFGPESRDAWPLAGFALFPTSRL